MSCSSHTHHTSRTDDSKLVRLGPHMAPESADQWLELLPMYEQMQLQLVYELEYSWRCTT